MKNCPVLVGFRGESGDSAGQGTPIVYSVQRGGGCRWPWRVGQGPRAALMPTASCRPGRPGVSIADNARGRRAGTGRRGRSSRGQARLPAPTQTKSGRGLGSWRPSRHLGRLGGARRLEAGALSNSAAWQPERGRQGPRAPGVMTRRPEARGGESILDANGRGSRGFVTGCTGRGRPHPNARRPGPRRSSWISP